MLGLVQAGGNCLAGAHALVVQLGHCNRKVDELGGAIQWDDWAEEAVLFLQPLPAPLAVPSNLERLGYGKRPALLQSTRQGRGCTASKGSLASQLGCSYANSVGAGARPPPWQLW